MKDALRALLSGSIDYAGLFPPATLPLEAALENYAAYIRSPDAWMLGAFVLPVTKFEDAAASLSQFDGAHRLRISALGTKPDNGATFPPALNAAKKAITSFNAQHGGKAVVDQLEMPLPPKFSDALFDDIDAILASVNVSAFWEAPADDAERTIALLAERNQTSGRNFGFKLRTGGVVASAFPTAVQIAHALVAAVKHRVAIKFTAGLHHPIRQFHSSVQTKMHGFLNVLGAGIMAAEHGWDLRQTATMIEDEDLSSFTCTEESFSWREWKVATAQIKTHRALITSLGSCSFDEPREDLAAMELLVA